MSTTQQLMSTRISIPKICQHCGNSFIARTTVTKYCGDNCAKRAYKKRKRDEKIQASIEETKQQMQGMQIPQTMQTQDILTKQYLSVQEAANLLGASRWTIQRMIKRDQLKSAKLGRRTIIARSEIDNLFN